MIFFGGGVKGWRGRIANLSGKRDKEREREREASEINGKTNPIFIAIKIYLICI